MWAGEEIVKVGDTLVPAHTMYKLRKIAVILLMLP